MNCIRYTGAAISLLLILLSSAVARACGPYYDSAPYPVFFGAEVPGDGYRGNQKQLNIALWQQQTDPAIPAADIEAVVYTDRFDDTLLEFFYRRSEPPMSQNHMLAWIYNSGSNDVLDFLQLAKRLQKLREDRNSPWYYPTSKYSSDDSYENIIAKCDACPGGPLASRYALQKIRALFASGQYERCIDFYHAALDTLPDSDVMKQMAKPYIAGIMSRTGFTDAANEYFASVGDFESLRCPDPVAYMASRNPDAPEFLKHIIRSVSHNMYGYEPDSANVVALLPVARKVLLDNKTSYKSFWYFLSAFIEGSYLNDLPTSRRHLDMARLAAPAGATADHIRAFRMLLDAREGRQGNLLSDLRWLDGKITATASDAEYWNDVLQHLIFVHWAPRLAANGNPVRAVQLANYADNLFDQKAAKRYSDWSYYDASHHWTERLVSADEMRTSTTLFNIKDYGSYTIQLMQSLRPEDIAAYIARQSSADPFDRYLNSYGRTDSSYLYDIAGTVCLRLGRYAEAAAYLARVSPMYQYTLNTYKEGYLQRDPMVWRGYDYRSDRFLMSSAKDAKLNFARRMAALERDMATAPTKSERGMAKLLYEIGRFNSQTHCWALTRYSDGWIFTIYLTDFKGGDDPDFDSIDARWKRESQAALDMISDPETAARAHLMLYDYRTVARRYGDTPTARHLRASCDNYADWLS